MNVTPSTTQTKRFDRSAHSSVLAKIAMRISIPPMVGVPALEKWLFGPSSRTTWPTLPNRSFSIIHGPISIASASPVITAKMARTVRYEKTLNPE